MQNLRKLWVSLKKCKFKIQSYMIYIKAARQLTRNASQWFQVSDNTCGYSCKYTITVVIIMAWAIASGVFTFKA